MFPPNFPTVGGMTFEIVRNDPMYTTFCDFVRKRIKNCTGLFLEFQIYLIKHASSESVSEYHDSTID